MHVALIGINAGRHFARKYHAVVPCDTVSRRVAMKAADVMTRDVISVSPEAELGDAIELMLAHRVSGLPVVTPDGTLYGMLTEGDLLRRKELGTQPRSRRWIAFLLDPARLATDYARARGRKVRDVMTQLVVTVDQDDPLEDVIEKMQTYHVKRLPVLGDGRIAGIISRADVVRALSPRIAGRPVPGKSDRAIHRMLGSALQELPWQQHLPRFEVKDGVVELYWFGDSFDWERKAARVAAEGQPGVVDVREHVLGH